MFPEKFWVFFKKNYFMKKNVNSQKMKTSKKICNQYTKLVKKIKQLQYTADLFWKLGFDIAPLLRRVSENFSEKKQQHGCKRNIFASATFKSWFVDTFETE